MLDEVFVDIKGYEGLYKISNYGKLYSCKSGYSLNPTKSNKYEKVTLYKNNVSKQFLVHRLVLTHFDREPKEDEECRHLDGNPRNNCITNLKWGTHKENEDDRKLHGNILIGENNGTAKLTNEQVLKIREEYSTGKYTHRQLANIFKVTRSTIYRVLNNKNWRHV